MPQFCVCVASIAAESAQKGIGDAATWASNGENWQKVGDKLQHTSPRDWGKVVGHVAFEVGTTVATAGAMGALNAAAKTSRLARLAVKAVELSDVSGLALKGAGKLAVTLAGKMKVLGKVLTGAKRARGIVAKAIRAKRAFTRSVVGQKLKAVAAWVRAKRKCLWDPIDITNGVMLFDQIDFELPGPLPLIWQRYWYSNSVYNGPLGWGWHHSYDAALLADAAEVAVRLPDGRLAVFAQPVDEERVFNRVERLELHRDASGHYRLWSLDERRAYCFTPLVPAAPHPLGTSAPAAGETGYRLTRVEDHNGFATQLAYDELGQLRTLTDCAGRQVRLHYDAAGHITALEAPEAEGDDYAVMVRYAYDEAGHLLNATDALDQALRYAYQPDHLMVRKTFRTGVSFYFEYAGTGPEAQCVHTWGDGDVLNGMLSFAPGRTLARSAAPGDVSAYEHTDGLLTRHTDPLGAVREWAYTPYGELALERDALGQVTSYEYDGRGNRTQVKYAEGTRVQTRYDDQDLPVQVTDVSGGLTRYTYDAAGNVLTSTDALGQTTRYDYDEQGRLAQATDTAGQITRLRYTPQHQINQVVAPSGQTSSRQYDSLGRLVNLTDARGNVQHRRYDKLSRLLAVREPNGTYHSYAYDGEDNMLRVQIGERVVQFTYTALDYVATRTEAGAHVQFSYDAAGRLKAVRNEHGEDYTFTLDAAGHVIAEVGFDGLTRTYQRDVAGRVTLLQRPAGRTTAYTYDQAGRVTEVLHNGAEQLSYVYRADGELLRAATTNDVVEFDLDPLGRVLSERQNQHTVTSAYDGLGRRMGLTSTLGAALTVERDDAGHVRRRQADTWRSITEQSAQGLELYSYLPGGLRTAWQHDALGHPTSQVVTVDKHVTQRRSYRWQSANQLLAIADELHGETQFTYDAWGNLAGAHYADGTHELRQPDAVGNLFRTRARTDRRYGKGGQLREANGTRYRYDDEGNLSQKITPNGQVWRYEWDGAGQLVKVTRPDGYAVTFTYDALGRRVSKRFRGKVTRWVWDGNVPLHEWHELEVGPGAGSVQELTTWLFEEERLVPLAKLTARGHYSVVCDHLGTPLSMYDGQGKATWEMSLDIYGGVRQGRGKPQDCPFRYQGQYEDTETGLYYNRFRYYDPEQGRYISQDPVGLEGGSPLYNYVSNPHAQLDLFGLSCSEDAKKLRANMLLKGEVEPPYENAAHHIAMSNSTDPRMQHLQKHLPKHGIDINSADNGVFLPRSSAVKTANSGVTSTAHSRIHTDAYKQAVFDKLSPLKSEAELRTALGN